MNGVLHKPIWRQIRLTLSTPYYISVANDIIQFEKIRRKCCVNDIISDDSTYTMMMILMLFGIDWKYQNTLLLQYSFTISAAFSPIINAAAFVWPATIWGIIDASTTRKLRMPMTCNLGLTTAVGSVSGPILQVPACQTSTETEKKEIKSNLSCTQMNESRVCHLML